MSKNFKDWLKNEDIKYRRNAKKELKDEKYKDDINCWGMPYMLHVKLTPINDINKLLIKIEDLPWDSDYSTMIQHIKNENKYGGIEDIDGFLQIFRCSLILYDQYKLKRFRNKYTLDDLMCGICGCFGESEDRVFKNVKKKIFDNIQNKGDKINTKELVIAKLIVYDNTDDY